MAKVFISYSHDSPEHIMRVRELADHLRDSHGLEVVLDQYMYPGGPNKGWHNWSELQVREAQCVLMVGTGPYCRRYEGREEAGEGLGVVAEARLIRQMLYDSGGRNEKFRVIHFTEKDKDFVPDTLKDYHRFRLYEAESKGQMVDWLVQRSATPRSSEVIPPRAIAWPPRAEGYVWKMAGRGDVARGLEQMLSGQSSQCIATIQAESNAGKTHLLAELNSYASRVGVPSSLVDCKGCPPLEELLGLIMIDLGLRCVSGRKEYLMEKLQQARKPTLLMLDAYEKASAESHRWIEGVLLQRISTLPGLVVVIAGQVIPEKVRFPWASWCESFALEPIKSGMAWHDYGRLRGMNITLEESELLASAGRGMPGVIQGLLENVEQDKHRALRAPAT